MIRRARPLLGTFFEISFDSPSELIAAEAFDSAFAEATRLENMMSFFKPQSEVSRLNLLAGRAPQYVSAELLELLEFSQLLSLGSDGLFDIAMHDSLHRAKDAIVIEGQSVFFQHPLKINLGGIAKGYIVDKTLETLLKYEVTNIVVNAGGDLKVARSSGIPVGIRDPRDPVCMAEAVYLVSGSIATSAPYFSFSTLFDPIKRRFESSVRSISVFAESCMIADALTKIIALTADHRTLQLETYSASALILRAAADGSLLKEKLN